jgi:hypothetical protein
MGTDTDCVHLTIVPVGGVRRGSTTGDAMMELLHIADGRDDCWLPWMTRFHPVWISYLQGFDIFYEITLLKVSYCKVRYSMVPKPR